MPTLTLKESMQCLKNRENYIQQLEDLLAEISGLAEITQNEKKYELVDRLIEISTLADLEDEYVMNLRTVIQTDKYSEILEVEEP